MITEEGVPFRFISSKPLQRLLSPIVKGLGSSPLNCHNCVDLVHEYAENKRHKISDMCRNNLVNLKIDCVTTREKSFLGINL